MEFSTAESEVQTDQTEILNPDEKFNKYFIPPSNEEWQILQKNIGPSCTDWLNSTDCKIYVPNYKPSSLEKLTGEHIPSRNFFIAYDNWMLEIAVAIPELNGEEKKKIILSFKLKDDTINEYQAKIDHPITQMHKYKYNDGDYKKNNDTLQKGTLSFLKFCREVTQKIDNRTKIYMKPTNKQRERIYKKAFLGQDNVVILY